MAKGKNLTKTSAVYLSIARAVDKLCEEVGFEEDLSRWPSLRAFYAEFEAAMEDHGKSHNDRLTKVRARYNSLRNEKFVQNGKLYN